MSRGGFDEGEMGSVVRSFDCSCSTSFVAEAVVETERFKSPVEISMSLVAYLHTGMLE